MFKPTVKHLLSLVLATGLLLTACGLIEPKESEPNANQLPETVLTAYPPDVYDHTVTFSWRGEDADGIVLYFETRVDGGAWLHTQRTDTTIVFDVVDNAMHTFAVRAYDEDGGVDPDPAERAFTATSIAPETELLVAPAAGDTVGPALTIELDADDPDDKSFTWRFSIDGGEWSEWRADSAFAFAQPSIVPGALGILDIGYHTFSGQARDAAGLIDPTPISVMFLVAEGTEPTTGVTLSQVNGRATYADGSMFTGLDNLNAVHVEIEADASGYSGVLAGFSYIWSTAADLGTAQFSSWTSETVFDFADIGPGQYWFIVKARDTAGSEDSTPESLYVDLVDPRTDLNPDAILLVQETRNGNGNPGSPTIAQVDEYYATMLAGRTFTRVNFEDIRALNRYVSPAVAGRYGLILWIDDDRSDHWLFSITNPENIRFLREYVALQETYDLAAPTHLLLSHWNLLGASNVDMAFLTEVFGVASEVSNGNTRNFAGAEGQGILSGTTLSGDPAKLPSSWQGTMSGVWAFEGPAGSTALTTWVSTAPDTLSGRTNAYHYATQSAEVVITGYPLYFMTDAPVFMDRVLQLMGF